MVLSKICLALSCLCSVLVNVPYNCKKVQNIFQHFCINFDKCKTVFNSSIFHFEKHKTVFDSVLFVFLWTCQPFFLLTTHKT